MRCFIFFLLVSRGLGQILVNGSFEDPALSVTLNLSGSFSLPGWVGFGCSSGGNAGLVVGVDNGLAPADGAQHFTFNGGNPSDRGWLEQSFATVPGCEYSLSFALGRSGASQGLSLVASVLDGSSVVTSGSFAPPSAAGYQSMTMTFFATGSTSTLRFTDTSGPNGQADLYLDRVAVSAVPEPATWAMWAGCAALAGAWWRRRRA